MTYSTEVFDSAGTQAIQRDGLDLFHVAFVGDGCEPPQTVTDDEHTAILVLIAHAIQPSAVADDELERARNLIHGEGDV